MIEVTTTVKGRLVAPHIATSESLDQVGLRAGIMIRTRTTKGKDVMGQAFRPYCRAYKAFREAAGRQTGHVDLNFSGRMMGSLMHRVEAGQSRVVLFFPPSEAAKAHGNQERWKRRFFELSESELQTLGRILVRG